MEKAPELHTIEKSGSSHIERRLEAIESRDVAGRNEALKEAQENLLTQEMYGSFLEASIVRDKIGGTQRLSRLQNIFVFYMQDLPDDEIDATIRQFNIGFKRFLAEYRGPIEITPDQRRKFFENDEKKHFRTREISGNIHPNSIKTSSILSRPRKNCWKPALVSHTLFMKKILWMPITASI